MVVSSVVHAVIYGLVFKVMHQFSLPEAVALVAIVLVLAFAWVAHATGEAGDRTLAGSR